MTITKEQVGKIAYLARLSVSDDEAATYATQLDNIFNLVTALQQTDTTGVKPMAHPLDAKQRLRKDNVTEENERNAMQAIAPKTDMGLYLVPQVIE